MDFNDTPAEAEFRAKVRAWIEANAQEYLEPPAEPWGLDEFVARSKAWQKKKYDAGYAGLTWPKDVGGQGLSPMHQIIFNQEESRTYVPTGLYAIGLGMCIPTVFTHGTPEIIRRYVPKALEGVEVWCQLFSEPVAGSDLASIRTRAVRDGDDWVITGQKVWTSFAHRSDFGIIITRTDFDAPKHKGLTMFIVDMKAPGVEARPIRQMSGSSDFNEVFFTDVRVPDSHRLGAVGDGWKVALTTLMHERLAVGGKPRHAPGWRALMELARGIEADGTPALERADVRLRIADTYIADEGIKLTQMRALSALSKGAIPGPEQSISKVVVARTMQEMSAFALELAEAGGLVVEKGSPIERLQQAYMGAAGLRIAGGTDEILRNIIAERVLGLPGDLRPDKDIPFSQIRPL
ncbi:MAG: acyl-CoA dehydrogenase family protein [Sphingomonadaceae bacterium]|uniref:acyl-CoA dehydrogenase family protein n=1 Tax=Thermaurantiacus sp. TaxID=2820283 RepID=UPI00298EE37D|nr:acyl-CoA dehydrogenase family protein [Thermaurantiacus sp.]MCS6986377.1 acyl-CoA dehydrogenase family protein [Sphingomonadaceae bacterium]MDW8414361.1 acyl-CoA dehydrogenase family protein [Thermaurantiacus sp.]